MKKLLLLLLPVTLPLLASAKEYFIHEWKKIQLTYEVWTEEPAPPPKASC